MLLPISLSPLPSASDGLLVYPQWDFRGGIPVDSAGPNYIGRTGDRRYRTFLRSPTPYAAGRIILQGLTFSQIQEGAPSQVARIELRIPENSSSQWGNLGYPQGLAPFTGLYLGSPAPGDTTISFAFTPGVHSTNGTSGDANRYIQVRITFFDKGAGNNTMYLGYMQLAAL